jgi:hypothetical protein
MHHFWTWMLVVGGIVTVGGVAASRLAGNRQARPFRFSIFPAVLSLLLPVAAFLLCLPSAPPFARGTEMGYGALLGLGAALVALIALRTASPEGAPGARMAALAGLGGVAVMWVTATELLFAGDPTYALYGGMAGGGLALLPWVWSLRRTNGDAAAPALEFYGLGLLVQGFGALLALERYDQATLRSYWGLPALALAGGLLGVVVAALALGRARSGIATSAAAALAIAVGFGAWVGGEALLAGGGPPAGGRESALAFDRHLYRTLLAGWVGFALLAALVGTGVDRRALRLAIPLFGVALVVIGFNLAGGYGVSLVLAAGLALAAALSPAQGQGEKRSAPAEGTASGAPALLWLAAFGVLFMAYRLFLAAFGDQFDASRVLDLGRHYVLVGLAVALVWAAAATGPGAACRACTDPPGDGRALAPLAHGAALVLLPVILFVVFGLKGLVGMILGLWVSQLLLPTIEERRWPPAAATWLFLPLVALWALIIPQWGDFMLDLPRWIRGLTMAAAVAAAIIVIGVARERERQASGEATTGEQ